MKLHNWRESAIKASKVQWAEAENSIFRISFTGMVWGRFKHFQWKFCSHLTDEPLQKIIGSFSLPLKKID